MFKQFFRGEGERLELRKASRLNSWPNVACASCTFFPTCKWQKIRVHVEIVVCHEGNTVRMQRRQPQTDSTHRQKWIWTIDISKITYYRHCHHINITKRIDGIIKCMRFETMLGKWITRHTSISTEFSYTADKVVIDVSCGLYTVRRPFKMNPFEWLRSTEFHLQFNLDTKKTNLNVMN